MRREVAGAKAGGRPALDGEARPGGAGGGKRWGGGEVLSFTEQPLCAGNWWILSIPHSVFMYRQGALG